MDKRWIAALVMTAVLGVACGGGGSNEGAGAGAAGAEEAQEQALEYAQCMRDHGIDMPDPEVDEDGGIEIEMRPGELSPEEIEEGEEACGDLMPEGPALSDEEQAEMEDAALEFAQCMRDHGIDMPDPEVDEDGWVIMGGEGSDFDPDDPDFQAAQEACADLMPGAEDGES